MRENIQSLSRDVGRFRKSHEASAKSLEKQVASLRKELAAHARADKGGLSKDYQASAKRTEKQVATLRKELSDLKSGIAKDAAKSRAKQEAVLSRSSRKSAPSPRRPKRQRSGSLSGRGRANADLLGPLSRNAARLGGVDAAAADVKDMVPLTGYRPWRGVLDEIIEGMAVERARFLTVSPRGEAEAARVKPGGRVSSSPA